ncbi:hypothetical protein MCOR25_003473 [Pyricularia grisea]|nr:hypothetical protein MCOR25_003473 [Pyricularia grisea]
MANLVSIITPMALAKPYVARQFKQAFQALAGLFETRETEVTPIDFTCQITLNFREKNPTREPELSELIPSQATTIRTIRSEDEDAVSLSQSHILKNRLVILDSTLDEPGTWPNTLARQKPRGPKKDTGKIALIQRATSEWKIDEVSVTVGCLQYSLTISLLCVIMVALGLTSAFTLGESIEGVDPFNIATFT